MDSLSVRRFGFALGTTFAMTYSACALVMSLVSRESSIRFFNGILHGLDVTPIMTGEMSFGGIAVGVVEVFVLGWLLGAMIAAFYNLTMQYGTQKAAATH
jgi:hypothetical protein